MSLSSSPNSLFIRYDHIKFQAMSFEYPAQLYVCQERSRKILGKLRHIGSLSMYPDVGKKRSYVQGDFTTKSAKRVGWTLRCIEILKMGPDHTLLHP